MAGELSKQLEEWQSHNQSDLREGVDFSSDAVKWLLDIAIRLNNEIAKRDELLLKAFRYMHQSGMGGRHGFVLLDKEYQSLKGEEIEE